MSTTINKLKSACRDEMAAIMTWTQQQCWRTAITVTVLALLAQAVLWVSTGSYHVSLVPLAAALGVYVFTSLRWLQSGRWISVLQSMVTVLGMLGITLVLYAASIHPARTMSELTDWEIITMCGASFASVVIFLISFIENEAGTWLHTRIPMVVMVGSGIPLGPEWMWLGLLFPATVLILARLARYVAFLFRLFIGNPVLHFVRKDQR